MNNYNFKSIVTNQEAEALKEMIFKRARERAQALTEDVQSSYTTALQNDIMELARDSFIASKNPFSEKKEVQNPKEEIIESVQKTEQVEEIGFAKRQVNEIKNQIQTNNHSVKNKIVENTVEAAMLGARADFSKKKSFMGALEFLNSQATVALIKNKGASFEAMA